MKVDVRVPVQVHVKGGWVEEYVTVPVTISDAVRPESPEDLASRAATALSVQLSDLRW